MTAVVSRRIRTIFLAAVCVSATISHAGNLSWPVVQAVHASFVIKEPSKAVVKTWVRGQSGNNLYLFVCRTGDDESVPDVIYAGDLDCRLMEAEGGEREANLLLETHAPNVAAWCSRGRMFAHELHGDCANYPEYGRLRHFRLRGMLLTLSFEHVRFVPRHGSEAPHLASYTLTLSVEPNARALRDIAEGSGYLDPNVKRPVENRSCSIVQRGNEWRDE